MTSWFNSWLRFWSLKMEVNGFPLQGALVWIPNIWITSLASPLKTWVVEGVWHGENIISPHIFFQYLKDSESTQLNMFSKRLFVDSEVSGSWLLNQTKLYFMSQVQGCPISQVHQEASAHGADLWTQMLEATHNTRSFLSSSIHSYILRAKQDCFNWPKHCWPGRAAPQNHFCADVRKIWDCFP